MRIKTPFWQTNYFEDIESLNVVIGLKLVLVLLSTFRIQSIRYLEHRGLGSVTSPTGATADWRGGSTRPATLRTIQTISTAPTSSSLLPASRCQLEYLYQIFSKYLAKWILDASLINSHLWSKHPSYLIFIANIWNFEHILFPRIDPIILFISGSDCV